MLDFIDFHLFHEISKAELKRVYETEFMKSELFNNLIGELHKKEIEYKFLEEAKVIKSD